MTPEVFDDRVCTLGEGPLWHPSRQQLFWFDILEKKLMTRTGTDQSDWTFEDMVSAAGWIDEDSLLVASATGLWRMDLRDGRRALLCPLEAKFPATRSNDGRADPWGGFWIGTMDLNAAPGAGAIYRYYQGTLRQLFAKITISNTICFAPDRSCAYYSDTSTGRIMRVGLDRQGWPDGDARLFVDLTNDDLKPDGAVTDADGVLWVALWGAGRIEGFDKAGKRVKSVAVPALQVTCPAFGGPEFDILYATSARIGLGKEAIAAEKRHGMTFALQGMARGLPEPRVLL